MSLTTLYLVLVLLPNLSSFFGWLTAISVTALFAFSVSIFLSGGETLEWEGKKVFLKTTILVAVICGFISTFLPNQKQILLIAGGYAATNSKEIAALPDNIAKAANSYLGKLIEMNAEDEEMNAEDEKPKKKD